jgi:hypothetical protein
MFIDRLIKEGLLIEDEEGRLSSHRLFIRARKLAHYVLSPSVKRSIKQITQS